MYDTQLKVSVLFTLNSLTQRTESEYNHESISSIKDFFTLVKSKELMLLLQNVYLDVLSPEDSMPLLEAVPSNTLSRRMCPDILSLKDSI